MARSQNLGDLLIESLVRLSPSRRVSWTRVRVRELTAREAKVDQSPRYDNERIRATRLKLGYSQPIFAKALNVSTQTVKA